MSATGGRHQAGAIQIRNLTKQFGDVWAVRGVTLDVAPGEFVTLLGPSGSGKTTTIMMIAGFHLPSGGEILIDERSVTNLSPNQREIGVVFQNLALFPHMTAAENIAFPLRMRHLREAEIRLRVQAVLELVHLVGYGARFPAQLSGGQQQRVALARAIVFNPPVLVMDEPLSALDRKLRDRMEFEIKTLHRKLGVTIVHVTHDQAEALAMSDRLAVMNDGRIEQVGTPDELYERPASAFVADFLGECNLVAGTAEQAEEDVWVVRTDAGLMCRVSRSNGLKSGMAVRLGVRPERICLLGEDACLENVFGGVVEDVTYVGDIIKYRVSVANGQVLLAAVQNRGGGVRGKRGDTLKIGWNADDVLVFPVGRG